MARLKNVFMVFMLLGKRMKIFVQEMEKKKKIKRRSLATYPSKLIKTFYDRDVLQKKSNCTKCDHAHILLFCEREIVMECL